MRRRGFAVHGLVVVLAVVVLGLGLYKASVVWGQKTRTAYASGYKFGIVASPFIFIGGATLLGWIAYRITRRSEGTANAVAGLVLAVPATMWSIQVGNYWINGSKANTATQGRQASAPTGGSSATATQQALRSTLESMKSPVGAGRAPTPTTPRPATPVPPPTGATGTAPAPIPPAAPVRVEEDPKIKQTLEALTVEVDAEAAKLADLAETTAAAWAKAPRHDRAALTKRLQEADALGVAARAMLARMDKLKDEAAVKLSEAGVDRNEGFSASIRYSIDSGAMSRGIGARELSQMCEAAREEANYLRENFTKWSLGRDGEVESKDVIVKGRAKGFRMRMDSYLDRKADIIERLKGKS